MGNQAVDYVWILLSAGLVFLMQAGFLCLETGLTRTKNNINVALKNIVDFGLTTLLFWAFGFALMFGTSVGGFIGFDNFTPNFSSENLDTIVFLIFQVMFCGTAVTILSGAVAERLRFSAYIIITILIAGFVYPIFGHWAWHGINNGALTGFLGQLGFIDFAGSTVVHSVGGWSALAILLIVGARFGRFSDDGQVHHISGSNLPLSALGVLLLWLGWFGFNGGSSLGISDRFDTVILVIGNTLFAGASGLATALIISYLQTGRAQVGVVLNGSLAGLVAITAPAAVVSTTSAIIIGAIGGMVMMLLQQVLLSLKIDDAVGAVPVHLGAGIFGTLAVGIFGDAQLLASTLGIAVEEFNRLNQIGVQALGVAVCGIWSFGITYIVMQAFNQLSPLRVTVEEERVGLNISEHGASNELFDLITILDEQAATGDLSLRAPVEPFTQVGIIAGRYNAVLARLENALSRTDAIVRSTMDAIITFSAQGLRIDTFNPAALSIFGYDNVALQGEPITCLLLPWSTMRQQGSSQVSNVFQGILDDIVAADNYREMVGQHADGTSFPIEVMIQKVTTGDEHFYTGTFRNITERKEAELAIQRSEIYYRRLIENSSDLITIFDSTANITFQSPSIEKTLGFRVDDIIGQNLLDFVHPDDVNEVSTIFSHVVDDRHFSPNIEFRVRNNKNEWRIFQAIVTNLLNEEFVEGIVMNSRDVTIRRQAEAHVRKQNEYLSTLHDITLSLVERLEIDDLLQTVIVRAAQLFNTPNGFIYLVDGDRLYLEAGFGSFEELVGLQLNRGEGLSGQVVQRSEAIIIDNYTNWENRSIKFGDAPVAASIAAPLKHSGRVVGVIGLSHTNPEYRFGSTELEILTLFAELTAIALDNAQLYTASQLELSERIRAQSQLEINRANLSALIENTQDFIWSLDSDYELIITNSSVRRGFRQLYGSRIQDGDNTIAIMPEAIQQNWKERYDMALAGERFAVEENYEFRGEPLDLEISYNPIIAANDRITGVSCIARNITFRKETERQLEEARLAAESANEAKSAFLANMSHELRTPLNAILGYSEMLEEDAADMGYEDITPDLKKIQLAGNHLLDLINNILDLSKIEAGHMELYLEEFHVAGMAQEVGDTARPLIDKNHNSFSLDVSDEVKRMRADVTKVRQALFNLLSNAAKFTENGTVTLTVSRQIDDSDTAWLHFAVSDTGIGMTSEQMQQVFQEFKQADASTTRKYGGTGLGLTISRRFCQMMGGDIIVDSEVGVGTTFTLVLPEVVLDDDVSYDVVDTDTGIIQLPELDIAVNGTVLVIDDDANVRDMLTRTLRKEGFTVVTAHSGAEGIELAQEIKPDAITLDVMMSGMDGWSVLTALKSDTSLAHIPVIMLTMVDNKKRGFALGAADYMTKPIDRKRLLTILTQYRSNKGSTDTLTPGLIMIVEDDPDTRDLLSRTLDRTGWNVVTATHGRDALEKLHDGIPTLILLDLMMPQMDGFQFVSALQKIPEWEAIPIVVITAKDLSPEERQILNGYVEDVLDKQAFSQENLVQEVRDLIISRIQKQSKEEDE